MKNMFCFLLCFANCFDSFKFPNTVPDFRNSCALQKNYRTNHSDCSFCILESFVSSAHILSRLNPS